MSSTCLCCGARIDVEGRDVCWHCEHEGAPKMPTVNQMKFAYFIADILEIDFPQSSKEFTAKTYYDFIHDHIDELKLCLMDDHGDETLADDMSWFSPLNQ